MNKVNYGFDEAGFSKQQWVANLVTLNQYILCSMAVVNEQVAENKECIDDIYDKIAKMEAKHDANEKIMQRIIADSNKKDEYIEAVAYRNNFINPADSNGSAFSNGEKTQYSLSAETDIYSRISDLQLEVGQIRRAIEEIESSDEFKEEQRKISAAFAEDTDKGIALYKKWVEESEYGKLKTKKDALEAELEKLRAEHDNAIATEALDEESKAIAKSGLSEAEYFIKNEELNTCEPVRMLIREDD